jgi:hypothetical protein
VATGLLGAPRHPDAPKDTPHPSEGATIARMVVSEGGGNVQPPMRHRNGSSGVKNSGGPTPVPLRQLEPASGTERHSHSLSGSRTAQNAAACTNSNGAVPSSASAAPPGPANASCAPQPWNTPQSSPCNPFTRSVYDAAPPIAWYGGIGVSSSTGVPGPVGGSYPYPGASHGMLPPPSGAYAAAAPPATVDSQRGGSALFAGAVGDLAGKLSSQAALTPSWPPASAPNDVHNRQTA